MEYFLYRSRNIFKRKKRESVRKPVLLQSAITTNSSRNSQIVSPSLKYMRAKCISQLSYIYKN